MNKEIYIHLGLPKTGTTVLQNRIFPDHHEQYLYIGKHYRDYNPADYEREEWLRTLKFDLVVREKAFFESVDFNEIIESEYSRGSDQKKVLLSEEAFLARCMNPDQYGKLVWIGSPYHVLDNLYSLMKHSEFDSVKLILILRSQVDLVESLFAQNFFRFRKYMGFTHPDEFVRYITGRAEYGPADSLLHYASIIDHIESLFGSGSVLSLPYEKLNADPEQFLDEISSFMGINPWNAESLYENRDNERQTDKGKIANVVPVSTRLANLKTSLIGKRSFGLKKYLKKFDKFTSSKTVTLSPEAKNILFDRYRESNESLRGRVKYISEYKYF
jgi:hypothetical protein